MKSTTYSISKAAQELGIGRDTLRRKLQTAGINGEKFTLKDLVSAMVGGDIAAQRLRLTTERANLAEIDRRTQQGELVPREEVQDALHKSDAKIRAMLDSAFRVELPPQLAGLEPDQMTKLMGERLDEIYGNFYKG